MIALKVPKRDLYNLLTAPRTVSDTYVQLARAQSCANHVLHIERLCNMCVTWCEGTAELFCVRELKSPLFYLLLGETING